MIDLHSHILPGLDDGAATIEDSLDLARAYVNACVRVVAATPHVRVDYPTSPELMEEGIERLRQELAQKSIPLHLMGGGEIALDYLELLTLEDLRRFGLAGNPSYLLLEFPYLGWPLGLHAQVVELVREGITPVLAHPERNGEVQAAPERLRELVRPGALVQITAASLAGRFGKPTRATAFHLVEVGLAQLVASDAHGAGERVASLTRVTRAVRNPMLARWLTEEVPEAIFLRRSVPDRPQTRRRRWRLGRAVG